MNISTESKDKLKSLKEKFYAEIKSEIEDKIAQDGEIRIFLDTIEKDYDYFFKSDDFIKITQEKGKIEIEDNFDSKDDFIENDNLYNLIICKAKIKEVILLGIEKYNKNNDKIKLLVD